MDKNALECDRNKMRQGLAEMPENVLDDFGYSVNRLHDPCNYDHTTIEAMLANYEYRDLAKSKLFRIAQKIFGDKMEPKFRTRTRTLNLFGMKEGKAVVTGSKIKDVTTKFERVGDGSHSGEDDDLVDMNDIRLRRKHFPTTEIQPVAESEDDAFQKYMEWFDNRKNLRKQLNALGLTESWLKNKEDRTEVEEILYQKMLEKRRKADNDIDEELKFSEKEDEQPKQRKFESLPRIKRPSPVVLRKIDRYLRENRLRLVDLFTAMDKNKAWKVSRDMFSAGIEQRGLGINTALLEDFIDMLDVNNTGEICYKDLVKAFKLYNQEKADTKNKGLSMPQDENEIAEEDDTPNSRTASGKKSSTTVKSAHSDSSTITLLLTPEIDLQESRFVLKSPEEQVDLRKRDKNFLKYLKHDANNGQTELLNAVSSNLSQTQSKLAAFKTGYKPIDEHCKKSMLEGETGLMINDFRQLKLKEYHGILDACQTRGVVLSKQLLDRVLLFPGDKGKRIILKQGVRQPGAGLPFSKHFADPPKRPRTPIEIRNKDKMKRGADGKLVIDYKYRFITEAKARPKHTKMQLPTGKAMIARKVDCWLTFEEYEDMTREFYKDRFQPIKRDLEGLTWPGYMLDKIRLYLNGRGHGADEKHSIFEKVNHRNLAAPCYKTHDNGLSISEAGYFVQGGVDADKQYTLSNRQPVTQPELVPKNHQIYKQTHGLTMHTKNTVYTSHA